MMLEDIYLQIKFKTDLLCNFDEKLCNVYKRLNNKAALATLNTKNMKSSSLNNSEIKARIETKANLINI